jgi:two-component system sensor histidine kinase/response regulator
LSGLEIFIVDDKAVNRDTIAELAVLWGMKPTLAESGARALELLQAARQSRHSFPLVVLDARMQGVDGFQVLRRIHDDPALAGSVVMALPQSRTRADLAQCRELGVSTALIKPIGQSELLDALLVALGVRLPEDPAIESPPPAPTLVRGRPLTILLAEDNAVNQKLAIRILERAGHHVTLARNGREALAALQDPRQFEFDVVLMDIQMPEMDGMEATGEIRQREKISGKHVPVLAMTANAMRGDRERYLAGGMDGYVSKPVNPADLFAEIERCVANTERNPAMPENIHDLDEPIDRISLLERVEGDHELLGEMIRLFQEDAPGLLATMRDALQRGDMVVLERSAHSLKGAAGNLSAKPTVTAAWQLEQGAKNKDAGSVTARFAEVERVVSRLLHACAEITQGVSK